MESGTSSLNIEISKFLAPDLSPEALKQERANVERRCSDPILLKMLVEGLHADCITLKAGGGSVQAHRNVLASVSPVFDAMFKHNMKEHLTSTVEILDMTIEGLQLFLLLLYTTNYRTGAFPEFRAAVDKRFVEFQDAFHKYQVVTRLNSVLMDALPRSLTADNCWDYYHRSKSSLPDKHGAVSVCHKYILDNYSKVVESKSVRQAMVRNPAVVQSFMILAAAKMSAEIAAKRAEIASGAFLNRMSVKGKKRMPAKQFDDSHEDDDMPAKWKKCTPKDFDDSEDDEL